MTVILIFSILAIAITCILWTLAMILLIIRGIKGDGITKKKRRKAR